MRRFVPSLVSAENSLQAVLHLGQISQHGPVVDYCSEQTQPPCYRQS